MMAAEYIAGGMPLDELLSVLDYHGPRPRLKITGLSLDSRAIIAGDLFLACAGGSHHGVDFAADAVGRGAVAVLVEATGNWLPSQVDALSARLGVPCLAVSELSARASRLAAHFYGNPSQRLDVIGVTGTNGKTSVSQFIAQAMAPRRRAAVMGTIGNGFPGQLAQARLTTADPVSVQANLALLRERGAELVAMEVSSHALHQDRVAAVEFDLAVLTNLSRDHLDYHGSMSAYAEAKSLLFRMPSLRVAVINADDVLGYRLLGESRQGRHIGYGFDPSIPRLPLSGWLLASDWQATADGQRMQIQSSWGEAELRSGLLGRFNSYNLLATLGVLLECGMPFEQAIAQCAALDTVAGRMQRFGGNGAATVVVDFAHTPDALEQALIALRAHCAGRLHCLFGCGGDRDRGKRPLMGEIAERLADQVWLSDDNPRSEDGETIIAAIRSGMQRPEQARIERDRALAIHAALADCDTDDLLLVAGKGHEQTQQIGDRKLPFSDIEQVQAALAEQGAR